VVANPEPKANEDTLPVGQPWLSANPKRVKQPQDEKLRQKELAGRKKDKRICISHKYLGLYRRRMGLYRQSVHNAGISYSKSVQSNY